MTEIDQVHIVASASGVRADQARMCFGLGLHAEVYSSHEELISASPERGLIVAEDSPELGGIAALFSDMLTSDFWLPVVATASTLDPRLVVEAVRAGALDYLTLPVDHDRLKQAIARAEKETDARAKLQRKAVEARSRMTRLTQREREVLDLLVAGYSNKMIARDLQISPRTVEIHRAHMMSKLGANHSADAVRMALEAQMGTGFPSIAQPLAA